MAAFNWPVNPTSFNPGPVQFRINGVDTIVNKNTSTPSNSIPLPVEVLNSGTPVNFANEATLSSLNSKVTEVNTGNVTVSTSVLPTGAATETTLSSISGKVLTDTQLRATPLPVSGPLTDAQLRATAVSVNSSGFTQPISAASLPLPAGAATETTLGAINTKTPSLISGRVPVDGSGVTQPVSATTLPLPSGAATETTLGAINTKLNSLNVVDQIDTTPLLDTLSTNIPASSANPLQVVGSLSVQVKKIVSVEDIGEYIGVYTGPALSEVLLCVLPLGGGEIEVSIPAATRISLRNMKNASIASGFIALNFLG